MEIYPVPMRAYTVKELANFYGITPKSFRNWIAPFKEDIGPKRGRYYNVTQVQIMFGKLGLPEICEGKKSPTVPS